MNAITSSFKIKENMIYTVKFLSKLEKTLNNASNKTDKCETCSLVVHKKGREPAIWLKEIGN